MKRVFAVLAACGAMFVSGCVGCGQGSSLPTGIITGRIIDARTGQPIAEVTVSIALKPPASTNSDGFYEIRDVPAGASYRVRFSKPNYVSRLATATLPSTAGDYPVGNGIAEVNLALSPATGSISGRVFAVPGQPAAGAILGVDMTGANYDLIVEVTAATDGSYSITGLPVSATGVSVTVVVHPYDSDQDGDEDFGAVSRTVTSFTDIQTHLDIDLRSSASAIDIVTSNVDDGTHQAGDPITIIFNRPINAALTQVTLDDNTGGFTIATVTSWDTATSTILTVTPSGSTGGLLTLGHSYQVTINAVGTNGATDTLFRTFTESTTTTGLGAVTNFAVTPNAVNQGTTVFTATWNALAGVSSYNVYVKDEVNYPAYVLIATEIANPTPSVAFLLPTGMDWFPGDGLTTPFANGNSVDFAVVPLDISGNHVDPSTTTPINKVDNTPPTVSFAPPQVGSANNGTLSPVTFTLTITFSEYMNTPTPAPTFTSNLAGPLSSTFAWNANMTSGVMTVTVPASTNATGTYTINIAQDSSGNAMNTYTGNAT